MTGEPRERSFLKALGPGLLWAGAAVGVSHLVQSTRAGAEFGFSLLLLVIVAIVFKYPAFSFGPRYAAATGTSLLEGYRRRGRFALALYAVLTIGTMFTIQAIVTMVTAALAAGALGWESPMLGLPAVWWLSAALLAICAALLAIGQYRWLDRIVKVVVLVLTVSTFAATALALPKIQFGEVSLLPAPGTFENLATIGFVVALIGWMPSAFDISVWHSLWTLARRRETDYAPTVRESLMDFNIGYLGTAFLALCFLTLGAAVMFGTGTEFAPSAAGFARQIISLYTENLGAWSAPLIGLAAFTVMFSTTLTVVDGLPRTITGLLARFREPEMPDQAMPTSRRVYWTALPVLAAGSMLILYIGLARGDKATFTGLVNLATTLSFLTAPVLAWLNHRAILGSEVPVEHRPGRGLIAWSRAGILFSAAFAGWFLYLLLGRWLGG
ncbi:MAG: divalent metal cation transporter [Planctomycetota bacterium]